VLQIADKIIDIIDVIEFCHLVVYFCVHWLWLALFFDPSVPQVCHYIIIMFQYLLYVPSVLWCWLGNKKTN